MGNKTTKPIVDKNRFYNAAAEQAMLALGRLKDIAARERRPIRSATFRVLDDGETRFHITSRKVAGK